MFEVGAGDILDAVVIQLLPVDLAVPVGVHPFEESLKTPMRYFGVTGFVGCQFVVDPGFEFFLLELIVAVVVVLHEDILHKLPAVLVHLLNIMLHPITTHTSLNNPLNSHLSHLSHRTQSHAPN